MWSVSEISLQVLNFYKACLFCINHTNDRHHQFMYHLHSSIWKKDLCNRHGFNWRYWYGKLEAWTGSFDILRKLQRKAKAPDSNRRSKTGLSASPANAVLEKAFFKDRMGFRRDRHIARYHSSNFHKMANPPGQIWWPPTPPPKTETSENTPMTSFSILIFVRPSSYKIVPVASNFSRSFQVYCEIGSTSGTIQFTK